jgi:hypothetical protein
VALNGPRRKNKLVYYPIHHLDPWRREEGTRRYVERDPRARREFIAYTSHMPQEPAAFIRGKQPYAVALEEGGEAEDHVLITLKRTARATGKPQGRGRVQSRGGNYLPPSRTFVLEHVEGVVVGVPGLLLLRGQATVPSDRGCGSHNLGSLTLEIVAIL